MKALRKILLSNLALMLVSNFSLMVLMITTGCAGKNSDTTHITANTTMDAEQLAQAGEQLVTPFTFMLADKVFDMSLSKDPNNKRAQFYKNLLKAPMTLKGAAERLKPYANKYVSGIEYQKSMNKIPNSPARNFLFDGTQDIKTAADLQNLLVQYRQGVSDFRTWVRQNEDLQLTLYLNWALVVPLSQEAADDCTVIANDPNNVTVDCNYREIAQRKITGADMVALSQISAGEILYLMMATTYSVDGIELYFDNHPSGSSTSSSPAQIQAEFERMPGVGKLRADHNLADLTSFGADFSAAWKYFTQNQSALCPSGSYSALDQATGKKNRKGYVFDRGICTNGVDSDFLVAMNLIDQALQGPVYFPMKNGNGVRQNTLFDPFKIARGPIQDLRSVAPSSYDGLGNVTALRDPTVGGIFPNGDSLKLWSSSSK